MAEKNIKKMLRALIAGPIQDLENTWIALLTERRINSAVGAQLDLLGKIVGQERAGRDDDTYRRYIRARIATNNSDGLVEDEIRVVRLVIDDDSVTIRIRRIGTGSISVTLEGVVEFPVAEIVFEFAQSAAAAGVRVVVEHWMSAEEDMFSYAPMPGQTGTGKGYGSTLDSDVGGVLASAIG